MCISGDTLDGREMPANEKCNGIQQRTINFSRAQHIRQEREYICIWYALWAAGMHTDVCIDVDGCLRCITVSSLVCRCHMRFVLKTEWQIGIRRNANTHNRAQFAYMFMWCSIVVLSSTSMHTDTNQRRHSLHSEYMHSTVRNVFRIEAKC